MLLQRFTKLQLLALVLILAGCGSSGPKPDAGSASTAVAGSGDQREIPSQAQTMFEQATAVMAAGDYLEAELRFKEFLLQYPGFPGAHVNLAIIHASCEKAANDAINVASMNPAPNTFKHLRILVLMSVSPPRLPCADLPLRDASDPQSISQPACRRRQAPGNTQNAAVRHQGAANTARSIHQGCSVPRRNRDLM